MNPDVAKKVAERFSKYSLHTYPKGQILVFADENPEHIFYLVRGRVREYDVSYRGDEVIVNVYKPAAFFPMSWAINRTPNHYFYKTETPVEIRFIPADDALEFIKSNPDVMLDLLSRLYSGLDGLLGRIVHLMSGAAKSRIVYELIIECRRFGDKGLGNKYTLYTNEMDLAARSGLSRETVSREIQKLKEAGLVHIEGKVLFVQDLPALEDMLGGEI
ncbi:MAG: Crp/Fnr family transcriptional regulator [Candidatus Saccharimonadales bacterium]